MKIRIRTLLALSLLSLLVAPVSSTTAAEPKVYDLGKKLELFVDRVNIESITGARLALHSPRPAETALQFDAPWEGKYSGYVTVFPDGSGFKMYYRGWPRMGDVKHGDAYACLAVSDDGIRWTRPNFGLFDFDGSKANNIVWGNPSHNFAAFKDTNPKAKPEQLYKALQVDRSPTGKKGLMAYGSPDGIHWQQLSEEPVFTKGAFDSQNLAFFDPNYKQYRCYFRVFINGIRAVSVTTSDDFLNWSEPTPIDLGETLHEHFYTNATTTYFRAPHYYFAFPKRFMKDRQKLLDHKEKGISDAVFLSSRDGIKFDRTFPQAFIRPGRSQHSWGDRSTMTAWGVLQTAPDEMSVYYSQDYRYPTHQMRRGVLRLDGIASLKAGAEPGELITKPIRFDGKKLVLNYATSAAGSVRIEIQGLDGKPLPGYSLDDAPELYGDEIAEAYKWKSGDDVGSLAGKPVKLRFVVQDADVYSYKFE